MKKLKFGVCPVTGNKLVRAPSVHTVVAFIYQTPEPHCRPVWREWPCINKNDNEAVAEVRRKLERDAPHIAAAITWGPCVIKKVTYYYSDKLHPWSPHVVTEEFPYPGNEKDAPPPTLTTHTD